jgi:hypothetical protein
MPVLPKDFDFGVPWEGSSDHTTAWYVSVDPNDGAATPAYRAATLITQYRLTGSALQANSGTVSCTHTDSSGTHDQPRAFATAVDMPENTKIEASFRLGFPPSSTGPQPVGSDVVEFSLFARIQDGGAATLTGGTGIAPSYGTVDCYRLRWTTSGATLQCQLHKIVGGTATLLQNDVILASIPHSLWSPLLKLSLRWQIITSGGDVTHRCQLTDAGFGGIPFVVPASPYLIFQTNVTELSASSPLTGAGMAGFAIGRDRTVSTTQSMHLIDKFRVAEISAINTETDLKWDDDFVRMSPTLTQNYQDQYGSAVETWVQAFLDPTFTLVSTLPQQQFTLDGFGIGTSYAILGSQINGGNSRAKNEAPTDTANDYVQYPVIYSRPPTDQRIQHRSSQLFFGAGTQPGEFRTLGLMLRASLSGASLSDIYNASGTQPLSLSNVLSAYVVQLIRRTATATYDLGLYRYRPGGEDLIAFISDITTAGLTAPTLGVLFQLEFEVYPQENQPTLDGPAVMEVKYLHTGTGARTAVTGWVSQDATNVSVSGSIVTDSHPQRILTGGEGYFSSQKNGGTTSASVEVWDLWTEETLKTVTTPRNDLASIAIAGENKGSANFNATVSPSWDVTETRHHDRVQYDFESLETLLFRRWKAGRRRFLFESRGLLQTELASVVSFWDAREGSEEGFKWTPPGEATALDVRFVPASLDTTGVQRDPTSGLLWGARFEIEELI